MKTSLLLILMVAFGNSYAPNDVQRAFLENEIVPDILNVVPKKIINVSDL